MKEEKKNQKRKSKYFVVYSINSCDLGVLDNLHAHTSQTTHKIFSFLCIPFSYRRIVCIFFFFVVPSPFHSGYFNLSKNLSIFSAAVSPFRLASLYFCASFRIRINNFLLPMNIYCDKMTYCRKPIIIKNVVPLDEWFRIKAKTKQTMRRKCMKLLSYLYYL